MAEQNASFVSRIRQYFKAKDPAPDVKKSEYRPAPETNKGWMKGYNRWLHDAILKKDSRLDCYEKYKFLDLNLSEASAALNIYADNIVSGAIGGAENYAVMIDTRAPNAEALNEIVSKTEARTRIKDNIWEISRNLTLMGDNWQEVVIGQEGSGEYYIERLKRLSPATMFVDVDDYGVLKDPEKPFIQRLTPHDKEGIKFDKWRMIHFKIGQGVYGFWYSLFANASQRIGRQLLWIDDAIVMARISRAYMRYAYNVDVSGIPTAEVWDYLDNFMERIKRKEIVDSSTGEISLLDSPFMPDEDIAIPISEGSKQSIQVLAGDLNIGNIEDVHYLQNKFLMAVSIPKAYMSVEEGTRSKATLQQIDVQFARQVRRRQRALIPGLREFYSLAFILAGVHPASFKWDIVFPELATTDENLLWEMYKIKAEVAKLLVVDTSTLNNRWVMEVLLKMNEDEIAKYSAFTTSPEGPEPDQVQIPEVTADLIRKDPQVRQVLNDLKDLLAWNHARKEKMENMMSVGIDREGDLRDDE